MSGLVGSFRAAGELSGLGASGAAALALIPGDEFTLFYVKGCSGQGLPLVKSGFAQALALVLCGQFFLPEWNNIAHAVILSVPCQLL